MEWINLNEKEPPTGRYLVLTGFNQDNLQEACFGGGKWVFRDAKYENEAFMWCAPYPKLPWQKEGE